MTYGGGVRKFFLWEAKLNMTKKYLAPILTFIIIQNKYLGLDI